MSSPPRDPRGSPRSLAWTLAAALTLAASATACAADPVAPEAATGTPTEGSAIAATIVDGGGSEGGAGTEDGVGTFSGEASTGPAGPAAEASDPSSAADDPDQDGFGADDNCPGVFNLDQADDDGDGIGNACDEPIRVQPGECDFGNSLAGEASANGDTTTTSICASITSVDRDPWPLLSAMFGPDSILIQTDRYAVFDLTDDQLAAARNQGLETILVDTIAGRDAADLAAIRIEEHPDTALATVDPDVLPEIPVATLSRVPSDVLARQPDRTLAAVPDRFWIDAPASTIEEVGPERLARLNPALVTLDPGRFDLGDSRPFEQAPLATVPADPSRRGTTTTGPTTSTGRAGGDG